VPRVLWSQILHGQSAFGFSQDRWRLCSSWKQLLDAPWSMWCLLDIPVQDTKAAENKLITKTMGYRYYNFTHLLFILWLCCHAILWLIKMTLSTIEQYFILKDQMSQEGRRKLSLTFLYNLTTSPLSGLVILTSFSWSWE